MPGRGRTRKPRGASAGPGAAGNDQEASSVHQDDAGGPTNVADVLAASAARDGGKPALVFRDRPVSYARLDERVSAAAAALAGLGVASGDRVALLMGNVPEFVEAFYGSLRAGAIASPLNVMLTPEELGYVLADSEAKVVVAEMAYLPGILSVRDRLSALEQVLVVGGPPAPGGTRSFEEAVSGAGSPPELETGPDDLAVIAYTSGTTANPKGAMLTHGNLLANLSQMASVPELAAAEDDVVLLVLPMFHIYGLNAILGLTLQAGATAVLEERFDPVEALELVSRQRVTVLFGAPPMFVAWLGVPDPERFDLSSVRLAVSGAAPLPGEVLRSFRERFGIDIWEGYGLTETAPAVTTNALGDAPRPDSIGLPLPGVEVRLVDEHGEDVEDDDPGEIVIRGPNVFQGYWGRPEESEAALAGGWLRTGDIAYRDDDGYLFIVDRTKDLVIVSGFNVYPKEVEDAIVADPRVAEAAVVGIPDERTGEAVKAFVVPEEGQTVTGDEIREWCRGTLARFKWPKVVEVVSELPHLLTGKVLRRALREGQGPSEASQATEGAG